MEKEPREDPTDDPGRTLVEAQQEFMLQQDLNAAAGRTQKRRIIVDPKDDRAPTLTPERSRQMEELRRSTES